MRLTKNFHLHEICHPLDKEGISLINKSKPVLANATTLAVMILQPLSDEFKLPIAVSSWLRSPRWNTKVGGSETSDHLEASAADLVPCVPHSKKSVILKRMFTFVINNLDFDQAILHVKDDQFFLHLSYRRIGANRRMAMEVSKEGKLQKVWVPLT